MSRVLVLGTGTQGLAIIHALKRAGHHVALLYNDSLNYGALSRFVDVRIRCAELDKSPAFASLVADVVAKNHNDVVIPMGDTTAQMLSLHKHDLLPKVRYQLPDYDDFMRGYDKNLLMKLCQAKGYPHPLTFDLSEIDVNADTRMADFPFPALLKPNITTGGRGMVRVNNLEELRMRYSQLHKTYGDYHVQQFIPSGGRQVKVQLYRNADGSLRAATMLQKMRWYPVQGGSNSCAVTIYEPATIDLCRRILQDLNWEGFADFDLIENPLTHELLVMEINPRVPACIKAPIAAGVNWAQVIVEGYLGLPATDFHFREGVTLRHLGFETLWFMKSPDRWHARPNWFRFWGNDVYYQDMSNWTDPMPFLGGTWRNLKKVLTGHGKGTF